MHAIFQLKLTKLKSSSLASFLFKSYKGAGNPKPGLQYFNKHSPLITSKPFWGNERNTRNVWFYLLSRLTTVMIFKVVIILKDYWNCSFPEKNGNTPNNPPLFSALPAA